MELDVNRFARLVDHLESMAPVAVHESVAVWGSPIAEQEADLRNESWSRCQT